VDSCCYTPPGGGHSNACMPLLEMKFSVIFHIGGGVKQCPRAHICTYNFRSFSTFASRPLMWCHVVGFSSFFRGTGMPLDCLFRWAFRSFSHWRGAGYAFQPRVLSYMATPRVWNGGSGMVLTYRRFLQLAGTWFRLSWGVLRRASKVVKWHKWLWKATSLGS